MGKIRIQFVVCIEKHNKEEPEELHYEKEINFILLYVYGLFVF